MRTGPVCGSGTRRRLICSPSLASGGLRRRQSFGRLTERSDLFPRLSVVRRGIEAETALGFVPKTTVFGNAGGGVVFDLSKLWSRWRDRNMPLACPSQRNCPGQPDDSRARFALPIERLRCAVSRPAVAPVNRLPRQRWRNTLPSRPVQARPCMLSCGGYLTPGRHGLLLDHMASGIAVVSGHKKNDEDSDDNSQYGQDG
jgi:hypothetical protein